MSKSRNSVLPNGPVIRAIRQKKGFSQHSLSLKIKTSLKTISRIENGMHTYLATLELIAEALTVDDISSLIIEDVPSSLKRGHRNSLKYFRDMRDVLKWDDENIKAQWFRKTGPIAADFRAGYIYERKELLKELNELITRNPISILEGDGGTGKTVVVRNYAYDLISDNSEAEIFYYSFKSDLPINDFREFAQEMNSMYGHIIIEDIHLSIQEMQTVLDIFNQQENNAVLLLTVRSMFKVNILKCRSNTLNDFERLSLGSKTEIDAILGYDSFNDTDKIIDHYIHKQFGEDFPWVSFFKQTIQSQCKNSLWLLTYALSGCTREGFSAYCVKEGVIEDLNEIEKLGGNPEILLALSPLYKHEIPTSQLFLLKKLKYNRNEINMLVEMGEIIKQDICGKVCYSLPHSSLASAYWEYGDNYRACLSFQEDDEYLYHYVISGVPNGLDVVTCNSYETTTRLLNRLAGENKFMQVIENEKNIEAISSFSNILADRFRSDFNWPYKLDEFYYSADFLKYLSGLLLKHHLFVELSALTWRYQLILKEYIYSMDINFLLSEIYSSSNYADGCEYLYRIGGFNNDLMSEIRKKIDLSKIIDAANRDNLYLWNIWITLKYLRSIDKSLVLKFWKDLDKEAIVNNFIEADYNYHLDHLERIASIDKEIEQDICKRIDCNKLAKIAGNSKNPFTVLSALKYLLELDENIQMDFWNALDKKLLAKMILEQECLEKIVSCLCNIFELSQKIQENFFGIYLNLNKVEELFYESSYFSSLVKNAWKLSMSDNSEGVCKLFHRLNPAKVEKLYNLHADILERIKFLVALCKIKSPLGDKLIHLMRKDAEEISKTMGQGWNVEMISTYHDIAEADVKTAQIIYEYICKNIGIENYIKKILDTESYGYKDDCFRFLIKVDPENKENWGQYFNYMPIKITHRKRRRKK